MAVATLHVMEENAETDPVLVSVVQFTNGKINQDNGKQLQFKLFKSSDSEDVRKKNRKTLIAETKKMKYTGNNFGLSSRSSSLCKYYVGVYNKPSGTMKVYNTTLFQMQPKTSVDNIDNKDTNGDLSFMEKNDRLLEAFGSTKRKRAIKSRLQNAIDANDLDQSVSTAVTHMLASPGQSEVPTTTDENDMLPKYNKEAKNTIEIYPLSSLLLHSDMDVLKTRSKDIIADIPDKISLWRTENRFCEYVLNRMSVLPVNKVDKLRKVSLLLYFSYLVQFSKLLYKDVRKKDPLPGLPDAIKEKILSLFSLQQGKSRCIPKRLKDKLIIHIIVLALIIDGFTIDCDMMCKELKMTVSRFSNYARTVGCDIQSAQDSRKVGEKGDVSKRAVLQAPLHKDFPNHIPTNTRKK